MSLGRRYRAERKLHFRARNLYKIGNVGGWPTVRSMLMRISDTGVDDPQREQTVASVETTVLETNRSLHHFHGPNLQILVAMLSQYDILFTSQKIISVLGIKNIRLPL